MSKVLVTFIAIAVIRVFWEESIEEEDTARKILYAICSCIIVGIVLMWLIK